VKNLIKIKICGITRKEDALLVAELGAWAVGFIFVKNTPRYISPDNSAEIIALLPENIERVGVFADVSLEEIKNIAIETGITKIQLHGEESPEFCENLAKLTGKEIIKAIRVKTNCHSEACEASRENLKVLDCRVGSLAPAWLLASNGITDGQSPPFSLSSQSAPRNDSYIYKYKDKVSFVLLDSYSESQLGGTGKAFNWEIAKKAKEYEIPVILAGGLNPDNAKQAYETVKPYALDISSGVESDKGVKDAEKLRKLFSAFY